ncbi:hypothetical protein [Bradyrhizobium jicamae]|uniref:hypothetical protein n=1 Tax=Bradyrhizobium jicamae TaxID=280332 RepID=UPI001BA56A77|nr:hypothetical protein [Bradyrhizobium jicamae]
MDVLFAVQSHPKPPSKPEASSHSYPDPEARVPAKRLLKKIIEGGSRTPAKAKHKPSKAAKKAPAKKRKAG